MEWKSKKSPPVDSYEYRKWITFHGFGYDHVNDKYKVRAVCGNVSCLGSSDS